MSGIEELKELNRKLGMLLDDPHPGLMTWRSFLHEYLSEMSKFSGESTVRPASSTSMREAKEFMDRIPPEGPRDERLILILAEMFDKAFSEGWDARVMSERLEKLNRLAR